MGKTSAETYHDIIANCSNPNVAKVMDSMHELIGPNAMMAYLVMMTARLIELHRVLKSTGSIYLHCDPRASHYLKLVMDAVFGTEQFGNEIVWKRTSAKGLAFTRFASNHDIILRYTKTTSWIWNPQYGEYDPDYLDKFYRYTEPETGRRYTLDNLTNPNPNRPNLTYEFLGIRRVWRWTKDRMQNAYEKGLIIQTEPGAVPRLKRYLDEQEGMPIGDTWTDIRPVQSQAAERLGYPTQKPEALLERIIEASSNKGDIVLDPFCGCGTTIVAAQRLKRRWIGIDITYLAVGTMEWRLRKVFPKVQYTVFGAPKDLASARALAQRDKYQFQWWAVTLAGGQPYGGRKKGADTGIDGFLYFVDDKDKVKKAIISVKGGANITVAMVRDLGHVIEREKADIGVFITLEPPTRPMATEATTLGFYTPPLSDRKYPRLQILTIEELLQGKRPEVPNWVAPIPSRVKEKQAEYQAQKLL